MFQDWLRKHRRPIFWLTLILIIFPFVAAEFFMGSPGPPGVIRDQMGPIAMIGDEAVSREEFQQVLAQEFQRRAQFGEDVTYEDLVRTGAAMEMLDGLIRRAALRKNAREAGYSFRRDYLQRLLQQDALFQDEQGRFDRERWNEVVRQPDIPWENLYQEIEQQARQDLALQRALASARVVEPEIREEFERENTYLTVRYVEIEAPVDLTEEEVRAHFETNEEQYYRPAERRAELARISLAPPRPELADELAERARDGEDFAELAETYSVGDEADEGGDLNWILLDEEALPAERAVLLDMAPGDVSDPVGDFNRYSIYFMEDEREDEETGLREVHVRVIEIEGALDPEEREALEAEAEALVEAARESGDFAAAAADAGVEVHDSGYFTSASGEIDNVAPEDTFTFRTQFAAVDEGELPEPVQTPRNIYVGQIVEVTEPELPPFEDVAEEVREDAENAYRNTVAYRESVAELAQEIADSVNDLDDIASEFPDVIVETGETEAFSVGDFDYGMGLFWNPREIHAQLGGREPGAFAGPIHDFLGQVYFLELLESTPPSEEDWEERYPEERDSIRDRLLAQRRQEVMLDYTESLYLTALETVPVETNWAAFANMLGIVDEDGAPDLEALGLAEVGTGAGG